MKVSGLKGSLQVLSEQFGTLARTGFFHIVIANTINKIIQFSQGILLVHLISKAEYGVYEYANNLYSFFALLSGFGIVSALLQVASEHANNQAIMKDLFKFAYRFGVAFNILLALFILITSMLWQTAFIGSNFLLGLFSFLPAIMIVKEIQMVWLRVQVMNKEYSQVNTINALIMSIITLLFALILDTLGIVIGQYIVAAFMVILMVKRYDIKFGFGKTAISKAIKKDLLKISSISVLNNALSQILTLVGTLIIGLYTNDASSIASYKVAAIIPFAMSFIPVSLVTYVYPYFVRNRHNEEWVSMNYKRIMIGFGSFNLFITALCVIFADSLIILIFGHQYSDAISTFRILMLGYFFSGTFRNIAGNLLVTQRKLVTNAWNGIVGVITILILSFLLIPRFGPEGAAWSYLLTMVVSGVHLTISFILTIRKIETRRDN